MKQNSSDPSGPLAFYNDRFLPQSDLTIPIHDAGFVQGATITDLCRTVRHKLYRWSVHLARFQQSCRATGIYPTLSVESISESAHQLIAHNVRNLPDHQDLALVMLATPGPLGYYVGQPENGPPTFLMHTFPLPLARYRTLFEQGVRLRIPSVRHIPQVCVDPRIKQRSRLHWWQAEREVKQANPYASALLLDLSGHVTETATANFLLVKNGVVFSPPWSGILNGVSLQVIRELCGKLGMKFAEKPLSVYDCLNADEAMLTNTNFFLTGVSSINGTPLPWPGAMFKKLASAWETELGFGFREQILGSGC